jgi:hypothetical protein
MTHGAAASMFALDRLRRATGFARPKPGTRAGGRRPRGGAVARRLRLMARRSQPVRRLAPSAFELEAPDELTIPELWSVWTVAHLESALALTAWRAAPREDRARAHRAYRAALAREAAAARILAERDHPGGPSPDVVAV